MIPDLHHKRTLWWISHLCFIVQRKDLKRPDEDELPMTYQKNKLDSRIKREVKEKQFFPNSFKICDLNLMGTSDMNENHDADPILLFPPILEINKKKASPVNLHG